jgi:hypothetical protein
MSIGARPAPDRRRALWRTAFWLKLGAAGGFPETGLPGEFFVAGSNPV